MAEPPDGKPSNRGRRVPPVISENFTRLDTVGNRSGRYYWRCNHCGPDSTRGARIEGCDNNLLNHLVDPKKCPKAPQGARYDAGIALRSKGAVDTSTVLLPDQVVPLATETNASAVAGSMEEASKPPAKKSRTLDNFFDHSISEVQEGRANVKLLRYIIHSNASFRTSSDWYFVDFVQDIRPSYTPASPYVLSHTLLDAEAARVQTEEIERLEKCAFLTLLFDGWEDLLKRSLYGSIAAEVKQHPIVLSLDDLTGQRGNVETLLETTRRATSAMNLGDMKKFIAVTTDNPTSMRAFRRELQKLYPWLLLFPCFLHGLNTIIGEISTFTEMKAVISKVMQVVSFFNRSHYWGGQLKEEATKCGIKTSLKQNCETRWYALVLHCMSVQTYRQPLQAICIRPDAQRSINGLSPITKTVFDIVITNGATFWPAVSQFIRTVKPLVNAIGNVESRDTTLADCMLELIRCARTISRLTLADDDNVGFWLHTKKVFNRRFYEMDSPLHTLALYLHPLCRRLAVSQVVSGRDFAFMEKTALELALQWKWSRSRATALKADLKVYENCRAPFAGGQADALEWWMTLKVKPNQHPLKALASALHSVVPHAGDIERLFSDLGGTQSVKRCRLSVDTFEKLSKVRANLSRHLQQKLTNDGKPIRRRHAHMHTRAEGGINTALATDLEMDFVWVPPLAISDDVAETGLEGPESASLDELDKAYQEFEEELRQRERARDLEMDIDGREVLEGEAYSFEELENVDNEVIPVSIVEDIRVLVDEQTDGEDWSPETL